MSKAFDLAKLERAEAAFEAAQHPHPAQRVYDVRLITF
jgi:hypothetical protein